MVHKMEMVSDPYLDFTHLRDRLVLTSVLSADWTGFSPHLEVSLGFRHSLGHLLCHNLAHLVLEVGHTLKVRL